MKILTGEFNNSKINMNSGKHAEGKSNLNSFANKVEGAQLHIQKSI